MNSLISYVFNIYANEVKESATPLRLCLATYVETGRNFVLRYDHTRSKTLTSLDPLGLESKGLFFQSGDLNQ